MDGSRLEAAPEIQVAGVASFEGQEIAGVEDLRQKVHGADVAVTQLSAASCRGALAHTVFDDMSVTSGWFTGDLRIRGVMAPDAIVLGLILDQTQAASEWGHETRAGDLLIFPVGGEQDARYQGSTHYGALNIPLDALMRQAAAFDHLVEDRHWRNGARLTPKAGGALRHAVRGCLSVLGEMGPALSARAVAGLRDELVERFLAATADALHREPNRLPWINGARIVRQVEDYLDQRPGQPVNTLELCQALALSRRTLHRAFADMLGMGPRTYLRLRALSAARKALVGGREAGASVTQVALDHGFWELGRFSVTYRAMFGESPSQTLRGAGGDARPAEPRSFLAR
jgi:AraC family ethanolamine operon transcriptional activator